MPAIQIFEYPPVTPVEARPIVPNSSAVPLKWRIGTVAAQPMIFPSGSHMAPRTSDITPRPKPSDTAHTVRRLETGAANEYF